MITNNKHDDNERYNKRRCKKKNECMIYKLPIIVIDLSLSHLGTLNFFFTLKGRSLIQRRSVELLQLKLIFWTYHYFPTSSDFSVTMRLFISIFMVCCLLMVQVGARCGWLKVQKKNLLEKSGKKNIPSSCALLQSKVYFKSRRCARITSECTNFLVDSFTLKIDKQGAASQTIRLGISQFADILSYLMRKPIGQEHLTHHQVGVLGFSKFSFESL